MAAGWSRFFDELSRVIAESQRQLGRANEEFIEYIVNKLETGLRNVISILEVIRNALEEQPDGEELEILTSYCSDISELIGALREILADWSAYQDRLDSHSGDQGFRFEVAHVPGRRGRPPFSIRRSQLEYLHSLGFTWTEMATLLGVSRMTLYRRRQEFGMLTSSQQTISDRELQEHVRHIRADSPYVGESMILGQLRALSVHASRERVRRAIRVVDPLNTALRWGGNLSSRRPYSVPGPNSLWHIDGHHKLVRWRFVTHCGIDGYSRLVVYLKCSNDNQASTVYHCFLQATRTYGVPSRVRCDQGRENIRVGQFMLEQRGRDRGSIIVGSSVHNQRVERLWRDMHRCATQLYYRLFYFLEHCGLLDPVNESHIFALHYIFLPRINSSLDAFRNGWNEHGVRTEGNHSPLQLYHAGTLRLQNSGLEAMDLFSIIDDDYGLDPEAPYPTGEESQGVAVPVTSLPLSDEAYEQLQLLIDPLAECDDYGVGFYRETLQFIEEHTEA